jgi:polar amino acid transport system substrate-binding protein
MKFAGLVRSLVVPFLALAVHLASAEPLDLVQPGKLTVATQGTFPPFSMRTPDGQLDGLEIRVMREVARRLHLEYTPVLTQWDALLVGLQAKKYDIISASMDITAERQKSILFSDGWLESGGRVVTLKGSPIHSAADLKDKTVGALVSSTFAKLAIEHGAKLKSYRLETDAIQDLVNGTVDAVITDSISGAFVAEHLGLPVVMTPDYVSHVQKGFAMRKDERPLADAVDRALADMVADGTYAKLTKGLLGYDPSPKDPIRTLPQ